METITIATLEPKDKITFVTTTDNRKLRIWNDKAARFGLQQGATFEIDTEGSQYGTHITKAKRVADQPAAAPAYQPGTYRPPATSPLATPPGPACDNERIFVQGMVQNFIRSGEVTLDNVEGAINKMRGVWKRTLGRAVIAHQMEAAE